MSVKNKVKRLNRELERLNKEIEELNREKTILANKENTDKILLENIIKFAITNQVGGLRGGMMIDCYGLDKMKELKLEITENHEIHAYEIRVNYY